MRFPRAVLASMWAWGFLRCCARSIDRPNSIIQFSPSDGILYISERATSTANKTWSAGNSTFNLANTNATSPPGTPPLHCWTNEELHTNPTTVKSCEYAVEGILSRDLPTGPLDEQKWGHEPAPEGYHEVPDGWLVQDPLETETYPCRIVLTSSKGARDTFRLLDVALAVNRIIRECLAPSQIKNKVGGFTYIGTKGFFVSLDGHDTLDLSSDSESATQ